MDTDLFAAAETEATRLGLEPAHLLAVADVETALVAFAGVGGRSEPLIRFEGHYFDRRLSGDRRDMARTAGLASPTAGAIRNPASQAARWRMLDRAAAIDRKAAYESTSWGLGQVMGAHWAWLGYANVDALVTQARSGAAGQFALMARYIDKAGLADALSRGDWKAFARGYNGPAYAQNAYDRKLQAAFAKHARARLKPAASASAVLRRGSRGDAVAALQRELAILGAPLVADGIFGARTEDAVRSYQQRRGLIVDGIVGPQTRAALERGTGYASLGTLIGRFANWLWRGIAR